jgi:hypothetical protein
MKSLFALAVAASLGGCAAIVDGTSEDIHVVSTPPGAKCEMVRHHETIASLEATPGKVTVSRTKHDIDLTCHLAGYADATAHLKSGLNKAIVGDVLLTSPLAVVIDSSTGADNEYPENVTVQFDAPTAAVSATDAAPAAANTAATPPAAPATPAPATH